MTKRARYCLAMFALLVIGAGLAAAFGFISADSWEYLHLAQAIRNGDGCSVRGSYFAALPCGYPLFIALTAPSADIASLLVSSKLSNLLLLTGAFLLVVNTYRNVLVPTLIIANPVTMAIYQYTWSENLFLFAVCGSAFAISRCARQPVGYRHPLLLGLFLLIGCAARYFFAPFAAVMFVGVWLVYGRAMAIRTFPAFVVAAVFFLGYQWFNAEMTGYASGMPRVAAPETIAYLLLRFFNSLAHIVVYFGAGLVILLSVCWKCWRFSPTVGPLNDETRAYVYLAWIGCGYLLLAFVLRALTHFDMYDTRTIGYGLVFGVAAAVGLFARIGSTAYPTLAALCCGLFAIFAGHGSALPQQLKSALSGDYRSPLAALRDYRAPAIDAELIISLATPNVATLISANSRLYYPAGTRVFGFAAAPFRRAESLDEFRARALSGPFASCAIDFTAFRTGQALSSYAKRSYVIDLVYDSSVGRFREIEKPSFDPSVIAYFFDKFEPRRYVSCNELAGRRGGSVR